MSGVEYRDVDGRTMMVIWGRDGLATTCWIDDDPRCRWGDRFAAWLARRGVTPASYRDWKVRWGFAGACDCGGRKETLNRIGRCVYRLRTTLMPPSPPAPPPPAPAS
jgi:hypothetical protein